MVPIETVPAADPLKVGYVPGHTNRLVVVFSGVGNRREAQQPFEFFKTATQDSANHALFICDTSRSWLNADGVDREIIRVVAETAARIGDAEIHLLGNSMGATMALMLKDQIPAKTVLAFVPQFSVHPKIVPEETRWRHFRKNIKVFKYPQIELAPNPNQTAFIVHGSVPGELLHAYRFPDVPGVRHFIVEGQGHSMTKRLKRAGKLAGLIEAAFDARPYKFRRLMRRSGGVFMKDYVPAEAQQAAE